MTKKVKNLIEKIEKTADEIDGLSLNDHGAWEKISQKLEKMISSVPKGRSDLKDLLGLAGRAVGLLAQGSSSDTLALVDAVYEALT